MAGVRVGGWPVKWRRWISGWAIRSRIGVREALEALGFGCLVAAAWLSWGAAVGLASGGVALLAEAWFGGRR